MRRVGAWSDRDARGGRSPSLATCRRAALLTEQGRELTTKIPHHLAAVYNNHLAGFSLDEFNELKQLLRRIISNRDNSV